MKNNDVIIQIAKEMQIRKYSRNKIALNLFHIDSFLNFAAYPIQELTELDVKNYLSYLYKIEKRESFCKSALSACRLLYRTIGIPLDIEEKKTKKSKKPSIINKISHPIAIELLCS
jgi:hypothetical protein